MTQQDYQELKAEVKKTMMAELFKTKKNLVNYEKDIYDYAFDRAYALGIENFQQDSDANWEKNMTQTLITLEEAEKALGISEDDITDAADWIQHVSEDAVQGIIKLETISKVPMLTKLYSDVSDKDTTCTPAEDVPSTKPDVPTSEPKPSIPKFKHKLGDKVRIVNDWSHGHKHNGEVTEIVAIDESDPEVPYKVDIYDEEEGGGLWYSQSDLESYIEPELIPSNSGELESQEADNESNSKYCNLSQETANRNNRPNNTLTDMQNADTDHFVVKHEMVDNIIKDGYRNHNRLHVASILMAGLLAGGKEKHPVRRALELADALTHEVKEGGKE